MRFSSKLVGLMLISATMLSLINVMNCSASSLLPDRIEFGVRVGDFYGINMRSSSSVSRYSLDHFNIDENNDAQSFYILLKVTSIEYMENGTAVNIDAYRQTTLLPVFKTDKESLLKYWSPVAFQKFYVENTVNGIISGSQYFYPNNVNYHEIFTEENMVQNMVFLKSLVSSYTTYWLDLASIFERDNINNSIDATFNSVEVNQTQLDLDFDLRCNANFTAGNHVQLLEDINVKFNVIVDEHSLFNNLTVLNTMNETFHGIDGNNGDNWIFNGTSIQEGNLVFMDLASINIFDYWYVGLILVIGGFFMTYYLTLRSQCNVSNGKNWTCKTHIKSKKKGLF